MSVSQLEKDLNALKNTEQAKLLQRFFKTAPGEYGHGDIFLGIMVPTQRKICKKYMNLNFTELQKLLNSKIHEHRFCALAILVNQYKNSDNLQKEEIFNFYIKNSKKINNWDLVDNSAPKIVGEYLLDKNPSTSLRTSKKVLYKLAKSKNLWQKRIAIIATFSFIKENQFNDTLKISKILLKDKRDLIHKAVGWMLREVGKRNKSLETKFIKANIKKMPRITLIYALEKHTKEEKEFILNL